MWNIFGWRIRLEKNWEYEKLHAETLNYNFSQTVLQFRNQRGILRNLAVEYTKFYKKIFKSLLQ